MRGKAKSKYDFDSDSCQFSSKGNWCDLPKFKRCENVIRCADGSKACQVKL